MDGADAPARRVAVPLAPGDLFLLRGVDQESRGEAGVGSVIRVAARHAAHGHWGEAAGLAGDAALAALALGSPEDASRARVLLGAIQFRRGEWDEAAVAWEAVAASPGSLPGATVAARTGLARLAIARGSSRDAREHLQHAALVIDQAGVTDDLRVLVHLAHGELASGEGRPHTAQSEFARAAALMGGASIALLAAWRLARANAALIRRQWRDAMSDAREALDLLRGEPASSMLEARLVEAVAAIGLDDPGRTPLVETLRTRHPARSAGRWRPWVLACIASSDGEEAAIDTLLDAHHGFTARGEVHGEFVAALALARAKVRAGAVRGALEWYRRAEDAAARALAPRLLAPRLRVLLGELEGSLAGRLDRNRAAISSLRPSRGTAHALLGELLPRIGARRAVVARIAPPDRVEPLASEGAHWDDDELRSLAARMAPEHLGRLRRGETVVCVDTPSIFVPLDSREGGLTLLVLDGRAAGSGDFAGAEELMLAGAAADALAGAVEEESGAPPAIHASADTPVHFGRFATRHGATRDMLLALHRVAASDVPVLLIGETGTGKELLARALHERSERPGAFVAQNCAAIPETLLEAEFFGHAAGAFTGAARARRGLLEAAHRGTFFLDEIAEMAAPLQAKLLRAIDTGEVRSLGELEVRRVEARIVSATHRDLASEVETGRFRRDLFYRLSVMWVEIPPLRERPEDILLLARRFLAEAAAREGKTLPGFSDEAAESLLAESWPGNVRELENRVRRAAALAPPGDAIPLRLVRPGPPGRVAGDQAGASHREALRAFERRRILDALERAGGNRTLAAKQLGGIGRTTLLARMKALGIR